MEMKENKNVGQEKHNGVQRTPQAFKQNHMGTEMFSEWSFKCFGSLPLIR